MKNPSPIHLMTTQEVRSLGWAAEGRDDDGHLVTQHAPFDCFLDLIEYVHKERKAGRSVTIFPHASGV